MIIFDLRCGPQGHVFEAWFGSTGDYEDQQERGLVSCPMCGAGDVQKAPMAPAVPKKGEGARDLNPSDPAAMKQMMAALAAMQRKLVEQSDWVGDGFASEARAIHLGDAEARSIHGRATRADAESLIEDGIPVAPLLFPVAAPGEEN